MTTPNSFNLSIFYLIFFYCAYYPLSTNPATFYSIWYILLLLCVLPADLFPDYFARVSSWWVHRYNEGERNHSIYCCLLIFCYFIYWQKCFTVRKQVILFQNKYLITNTKNLIFKVDLRFDNDSKTALTFVDSTRMYLAFLFQKNSDQRYFCVSLSTCLLNWV